MSTEETIDEAVNALQEFGLKEYEAKCFVGLSRLSTATARKKKTGRYSPVSALGHGLFDIDRRSPVSWLFDT